MSKAKTRQRSGTWRQLYHLKWWSTIIDFYAFFIESVFGFFGVATALYLISTLIRAFVSSQAATVQPNVLTNLIWLAGSGLLAYWGLSHVWLLILDVVKPTQSYEGQADHSEVAWVTGTHGAGYRQWVLRSGDRTWVVPSPPSSLKVRIQPGSKVRLRYRAGTETVTDVWVLEDDAAQQ